MFNRARAHPLWPVRRAAWALLAVGALPALTGGLAVGACFLDVTSGRTDPFNVLAAALAAIVLLIPGMIHLVFAVYVWRARANAVMWAAIYTLVLLGLLALGAMMDISMLVAGTPGVSGMRIRLSFEGGGMLALVALLWCLRAATRCLRTQPGHAFEVILPNAQPLQMGYPSITPPPARHR